VVITRFEGDDVVFAEVQGFHGFGIQIIHETFRGGGALVSGQGGLIFKDDGVMKTHGVQHVLPGQIKQDSRFVFFYIINQILDDLLALFAEFRAYLVSRCYANGHEANLLGGGKRVLEG